jgi:hypothetical protein
MEMTPTLKILEKYINHYLVTSSLVTFILTMCMMILILKRFLLMFVCVYTYQFTITSDGKITVNLNGQREPGSSVIVVSGYGPDDRVKGFFLWPLCPDQLWGPPSLLYSGYRQSFPRG